MTELIETIKKASNEYSYLELNTDLFDETITEWKKYRDKKAEMNALFVEGGSLYPTIYANSLKTTTIEKIESLKNEYSIFLKRYGSR